MHRSSGSYPAKDQTHIQLIYIDEHFICTVNDPCNYPSPPTLEQMLEELKEDRDEKKDKEEDGEEKGEEEGEEKGEEEEEGEESRTGVVTE